MQDLFWSKRRARRVLTKAAHGVATTANIENERSLIRISTVGSAEGAVSEEAFRGRLKLANWRKVDIDRAVLDVRYTRTGVALMRFVDRRPLTSWFLCVLIAAVLKPISIILWMLFMAIGIYPAMRHFLE